tara:strand:- start:1492 stop:4026 length:2535 start_codon:yes stop_codon:yes gene_type:complete
MALNPFFQQGTRGEQNLVQSLINEQLKIYGVEVYYIPREYANTATILREVIQSEFKDAYPIEAYVQNYDGFGGSQDLMSKFGVRVTDELSLIISKERYENYIKPLMTAAETANNYKLSSRPKEGDLIWFPLSDTIFEIKYVEHEKNFYQLRENYVYELRCEIFEYADEVIDTGITDIDDTAQDDGYILSLNLAGIGETATAVTTVVSRGAVNKLTLLDRGTGYKSIPIVAISSAPDDGTGRNATAVAITTQLSSGDYSIEEIRIVNPGAGYTQAPTVSFVSNTGSGAIATAGINTISSVGITTLTFSGREYITTPTVTFKTPTHVGAAATAILDSPMVSTGVSVTSAPISIGASEFLFPGGTTGGVFYSTAPTVTFSLPTGSGNGAQATATLDDIAETGGTVETLGLTTGGRFYTSVPSVSITHPGFSYASATIGIAGSSIDPGSIGFTTTGRAYTTRPNVSISTYSGQDAPYQTAVGVATIHPITGVVTAVSFNESDAWATGTGATVGSGYTAAPRITFSGNVAPVRATATVTITEAGVVDTISIGNSGFGYLTVPTVTIQGPGGANEAFRATGIATIRSTSIKTQGTIGIGSNVITGITTTNIIVGDRVRLGVGHSDTYNFIPVDTFVSSIGIGSLTISDSATNVGIATSTFEFGRENCGVVTGITITYGGGGYLSPPTVTISNEVSEKNYIDFPGISTATGVANITGANIVSRIDITDPGAGYVLTPTVTISDGATIAAGGYTFNEIVTGSSSGTTARVQEFDYENKCLKVKLVSGDFTIGETITGAGGTYSLRSTGIAYDDYASASNDFDRTSVFDENVAFEEEGINIIDFTEKNPFGNF